MPGFTERLAYLISANGKDAIKTFKDVRTSAAKDLGGADTAVKKTKASFAGLGAGLKGFGAGIAASFGIGAIDNFIDAASDLQQSAGAIESVFGNASGAIEAFGETADEVAGLSKREVNEMASVVGAQLKSVGFDLAEAADMAIVLEKRGADLAATFGGPTVDAVSAISATLRGERDPIERYGISIKQADVNARVAALGLNTTTLAAKKYAAAVATLDLLLEQSADSQGQFNREVDTAAGAQARATAKYENAKADFGKSLLPAKTAVTQFTFHVVDGANKTAKAVGKTVGALKGLFTSEKDTAVSARDAARAEEEHARALERSAEAAIIAGSSVDDYKSALDELEASTFDVGEAEDSLTEKLLSLQDLANSNAEKRADAQERYADAVEAANKRIRSAEEDVSDAREDLMMLNTQEGRGDARRRLRDAEERLAQVKEEADESVTAANEAREAFDEWTPSLDRATTAGLRNRGVLKGIVDEVLNTVTQMKEEGATALEINVYLLKQIERITTIATQAGFARDAMKEYLGFLEAARNLDPGTNYVGPVHPDVLGDRPYTNQSGVPYTIAAPGPAQWGQGGLTINQYITGGSPEEQQRQSAIWFNRALRRRG